MLQKSRFSALQRAEIAEIAAASPDEPPPRRVSVLFNEPKLLKLPQRYTQRRTVPVSVLFNEPKLLKSSWARWGACWSAVSVLFNEPKLLKFPLLGCKQRIVETVSVLFNEPKLLKFVKAATRSLWRRRVSVLFNEPKLLKSERDSARSSGYTCFSALQRAEIAEIQAN